MMGNAVCTAGFARLDITPPLGMGMGGNPKARFNKGVLDPLYVNAVAFGQGAESAVILVCDILGLYGEIGVRWPGELARDLGLEERCVFLCSAHVHTSTIFDPLLESIPDDVGTDPQYNAFLYRRLLDAAQMALDDRKTVTDTLWAETELPCIAFVRRYLMKDGTVRTNPKYEDPDIIRPASETDNSLRLVRIRRDGAKEIVLVNYQLHPDNVGGEMICSDFPGQVRRIMEQRRDNVHCVYLNGALGQLTPSGDKRLPRNPAFAPAGIERAIQLGEQIVDGAMAVFDSCVSTGMTGLKTAKKTTAIKTKYDPARFEEACRIMQARKEGRNADIHPEGHICFYMYVDAVFQHRMHMNHTQYMDAPVTLLLFNGLALVGLPGEPFNEVGRLLRRTSRYPVTFVCCQTNGCLGYFPLATDYELGGYEPIGTPMEKGSTEQITNFARHMLADL